jgi:lipid A 3-O-deacylase
MICLMPSVIRLEDGGKGIRTCRIVRLVEQIRLILFAVPLLFFTNPAEAQGLPSKSLSQGAWDFGIYTGGGTGLFAASDTKYYLAGGRIGRVLTSEHLGGWFRGNFEYDAEFSPVFVVFQPGQKIYGGSFTPAILKWNFTANSKVAPYLLLSGGGIVSTDNVPPGNTSYFNFMVGGSFGVHFFTRPKRAITVETHWVHISNGNLGAQNPQLVSNFIFTVGYSWFK